MITMQTIRRHKLDQFWSIFAWLFAIYPLDIDNFGPYNFGTRQDIKKR